MLGLAAFQLLDSSLNSNVNAINFNPTPYNNNQQSSYDGNLKSLYDRNLRTSYERNTNSSYDKNINSYSRPYYPKTFDKSRFNNTPYGNSQIYYQNTSNSSIKYNPRGYNPFNNNQQKGKPPYRTYRRRGYIWNKGRRSPKIYELSIDPQSQLGQIVNDDDTIDPNLYQVDLIDNDEEDYQHFEEITTEEPFEEQQDQEFDFQINDLQLYEVNITHFATPDKTHNPRILLDSGAEANFIGKQILPWLEDNGLLFSVTKLRRIATARTASNLSHTIESVAIVKIFDVFLEFYILDHLNKIIIGRPTLQKWNYHLTKEGEFILINNQRFHIHSLQLKSEESLEQIRERLKREFAIKYPQLFHTKLRPPPPREFQYRIQLTDHTQIYCKPYKCNQEEQALIKEFIDEKLEAGVLVPAPIDAWLHPIFPIRKTNANQSSTKIAVDLRRLNKVTVRMYTYPTDTKDLLSSLANSNYFSALNLKNAFYQIAIHKDSIKYFGISTAEGNFCFTTLPFGAINLPAILTNFVRKVLTGITNTFIYMDDILIHTTTLHHHITILKTIMWRLHQNNLQLNYNKLKLIHTKIDFLGYSIQPGKISPQAAKIQAIQNWQIPTTTTQIRAFVNFTNHFRNFIPNIAIYTNPLNVSRIVILSFISASLALTD